MANGEFTKNLIADNTKELIRNYTIDQITVVQICEQAGISRRNFYRYFTDKYDVVNYIYYHDHLIRWITHDNWNIWDYVPEICREIYSDRRFYANALRPTGENSFREYCFKKVFPIVEKDFHETFENDIFPEEMVAEFYIKHVVDMIFDYAIIWLSEDPCIPPDKFSAWLRNMIAIHAKKQYELTSRPSRSETEGPVGPGVED